MTKIMLVHLPFCTPASPPYSITALHASLSANSDAEVSVLDLNLEYHEKKFSEFQKEFRAGKLERSQEFINLSAKAYSKSNLQVVEGGKPEYFDELLSRIASQKPDIVAFSIVYSSQAFFCMAMLKSLKLTTVIGGPAVNEKLIRLADHHFYDDKGFLEFLGEKKTKSGIPDFSIWKGDYFTPKLVIPLKTTSTCYYQRCAFCAHYTDTPYKEYDIEELKKTIFLSKQKMFFLIDDMIPKKMLLRFAEMIRPLECRWACQLKPKDYDPETLKVLRDSGCVMILWGIESGSERVLELMRKGIDLKEASKILEDSHAAGISNVVYIMFGFPTETKEEFKGTMDFLEANKEYIDLVSPTVFGLQKGTYVYENPEKFGITIHEEERTVLEPKITYDVSSGMTQKEAVRMKHNHKRQIEQLNNYPKTMNFFREHMMCEIGQSFISHLPE